MPLPAGPNEPAIVQIFRYVYRLEPFLEQCVRRYGSVFTVRLGQVGNAVVLTTPEDVKQVFTGDPAVLQAGRGNQILGPLVGSRSVLLLDGEEHLRQRRLLLPPFHGERMQAYADLMRDITDDSIDGWPVGRAFSLHERTQAIALAVILRAVFGMEEGARMADFTQLLLRLFSWMPAILGFLPALQRDFPGSPYRFWLRRREAVDRRLYELIAERRQERDRGRRTDVLSLLMDVRDEAGAPLSDTELRDQLMTMIAAGHETTSTMVCWIFERLLCNPAVHQRVRAELEQVVGDRAVRADDLPRLEYLDAVIKETLRLRPVLPLVVRHLAQPWSVAGYDLPAGTLVAPCLFLVHRDPGLYPEPERFLPERFLGRKIDPYTFFPFGGGVRRCIGMAFAMQEMKLVTAAILARTRLRLEKGRALRIVRRSISLAPEGGTGIMVEQRTPRRPVRDRPAAPRVAAPQDRPDLRV